MIAKKYSRSRFFQAITVISAGQPLRTARLDFFGSVSLVCSIGMIAKLVQVLLAN
jgi:hypothetical protein